MIPTSSAEKSNIVLKEGQKVMVLKSPKGIYMQLESGKIIAIRTALKVGQNKDKTSQEPTFMAREMQKRTTPNPPIKPATGTTTVVTNTNTTTTATIASGNKTGTPSTPSRQRSTNHVNFGRTNAGMSISTMWWICTTPQA